MRLLSLAAAIAAALPALAQAQLPSKAPGSPDPARVKAGIYKVEPEHTQIGFTLDHLGFTPFSGVFSQASGTLTLDPKAPSAARIAISVPIASVRTTSDKLDEELVSPQFFNAARFPTATFVSTSIAPIDATTAKIAGTLTLHGVSKPIAIVASFYGAGTDFMTKQAVAGFTGKATIRRSDFGVGAGIPLVGDEVTLTIAAAFEQ